MTALARAVRRTGALWTLGGTPERAALALSAAAWLLLFAPQGREGGQLCLSGALLERLQGGFMAAGATGALIFGFEHWLIMCVAMMVPLLREPLAHVYRRSYARRRPRALTFFAAGVAAPWAAVGAPAAASAATIPFAAPWATVLAGAATLLAAGAWHASGSRRRVLARCHRMEPLASAGRAADRDCLTFGLRQGALCLAACGGVMAVLLFTPAHNFVAIAAAALLLLERERFPQPSPRASAALLGLLVFALWMGAETLTPL